MAALTLRLAAIVALLFCLGCGPGEHARSDDATAPEAEVDAGALDDPDSAVGAPEPLPPADPDPVVMTPCPPGWRAVSRPDGAEVTCDPWPVEGRAACEPGEAHFPGDPGCVAIGRACPADEWPEDLPSDRSIVFVRAGAPAGGDGSRDRPLGTVRAALAAAASGTLVAVATGRYDEALEVPSGVEVRGACARLTVIAPSLASATFPTVLLRGAGAALRDVSVTGPRPGVVAAETSGAVVEGVWIHDAAGAGVVAAGAAEITLGNVVVQRTTRIAEGAPGRGMEIGTMSVVVASRLVLEGNAEASIVLAQGASATLEGVALLDTLADHDGTAGNGISVFGGGILELSASVIERARTFGLTLNGGETRATLRDVVIRDVLPQDRDGAGGIAIQIVRGARVEASRVLVADAHHFGIFVADPGSSLAGEHLAIASVEPTDVEGQTGWGLVALGGASLRLGPVSVERTHDIALIVASGSSAELSSLTVRETLDGSADMGRALVIQSGGEATLARALLEDNREVASFVSGGVLHASDLRVRDTASSAGGGLSGRGLEAQGGATVVLRRAAFESNREVGVLLLGEGTTLDASDLAVETTLRQRCASTTCSMRAGGFGLAVLDGAYLEASAFRVASNELAGLVLASGGLADMSIGAFTDNPIGVSVRTEGFDLARLMEGVVFQGNQRTFDTTEIPVPDPSTPPVEPE